MTRGFDKDALRFYLEHAEETRLEREKFLRGEEVDPAIIPPTSTNPGFAVVYSV